MELLDKNGLTEVEFLASYNADKYPKPSLTADIAVFAREGDDLRLLLIKRGGHPYLGKWALPGGFANRGEAIESTAARELREETGVEGLTMRLAGVFSKPGRDPRGWVVTAAYTSVVDYGSVTARADDDAAEAEWFKLNSGERLSLTNGEITLTEADLAFDHADIIKAALREVKNDA